MLPKEDLLQFIWSVLKTSRLELKTTEQLPLDIIKTGFHNHYDGPDFKEAIVAIGGQKWAGNIEIHVQSADWLKHNHQKDAAYQNVVLHVVYEHNQDIILVDKTILPVLELKHYISQNQLEAYRVLMYNHSNLPCQEMLNRVKPITLQGMLNRASMDRFAEKSKQILELLISKEGDWNTVFYHQLAKNFGFKTNDAPFLALAESIPLSILAKHKDDLDAILSLCFGQAGFLIGKPKDAFQQKLHEQYLILKKLYGLQLSTNISWKMMKTRPANYPTLRIAQFGQLIYNSSHLFSKILTLKEIPQLIRLFEVSATAYWQSHSNFGQLRSKKIDGKLGLSSKYLLLINTVCQTLFAYSNYTQEEAYKMQAIDLLSSLPPENNKIIATYSKHYFTINNALESQGAIGLMQLYCSKKKCMNCTIGQQLVLNNPNPVNP